jgi:hypothetical protein
MLLFFVPYLEWIVAYHFFAKSAVDRSIADISLSPIVIFIVALLF